MNSNVKKISLLKLTYTPIIHVYLKKKQKHKNK